MGFFDRTSYLRALLILLPFGLTGLYFGITGLLEKESDLHHFEGIVSETRLRPMYNDNIEKYMEAYQIEIEGIEPIFHTFIAKHIETLNHALNVGDTISIWTREKNYRIVKLKREEELLLTFNPTTWMDILILIIGIVFTTLSVAYLIKHPEDLWGGDKEKMKRWWMG